LGYFKKVNFIFLIVDHIKNVANRLFNVLKMKYREHNIYTKPNLLKILNHLEKVTVIPSKEKDFYDQDVFLNLFYQNQSIKLL